MGSSVRALRATCESTGRQCGRHPFGVNLECGATQVRLAQQVHRNTMPAHLRVSEARGQDPVKIAPGWIVVSNRSTRCRQTCPSTLLRRSQPSPGTRRRSPRPRSPQEMADARTLPIDDETHAFWSAQRTGSSAANPSSRVAELQPRPGERVLLSTRAEGRVARTSSSCNAGLVSCNTLLGSTSRWTREWAVPCSSVLADRLTGCPEPLYFPPPPQGLGQQEALEVRR